MEHSPHVKKPQKFSASNHTTVGNAVSFGLGADFLWLFCVSAHKQERRRSAKAKENINRGHLFVPRKEITMMIIDIMKEIGLKDGQYLSIISDFQDYPEKDACLVKFNLFYNKGEYKEVTIRINTLCENDTVGYRFFEALGISDMKSVDTDFLKSEFQGSYVGIVIKNNEKNGVVYHNVVDFFEVDIEDSEEKDDEKYEDESEEDYYDEYEDDFEEEYDDEYEDDFEDFDRITSRRRNSKTIPRREKKRRKTNRR